MKSKAILFFFFFQSLAFAQIQSTCDSLIKLGISQLEAMNHIASLENLNRAYVLAKEKHWHDQAFLALNNIGANYYALLNYGEALHYYLEAYQISISHLNQEREMIVLNNIAILYMNDQEYSKAAEYGERALAIANKANNVKRIGLYSVNLGLIYNKLGEMGRAAGYFEKVEQLKIDNKNINYINKIGKAENLQLAGNYLEATSLIQSLLPTVEKESKSQVVSHLYLLYSKILLQQKQYKEAIYFGNKASLASPDLESKISAYHHLAQIYISNTDYQAAVGAKDSLLRYSDSLQKLKNGKYFESNKMSFEIKKYQQDAANSTLALEQERKLHYALLGGAGALFLALALGFRNSFLKNKQKKEAAEKDRAQALLALKAKESEKLILEKQMLEKASQEKLERANLKHEIEIKNRKLSAKTLYVAERNEIIENILQIITSEKTLQKNITVKAELKKLKDLIKNDASWEDFANHFETVNHGFLDTLKSKHPALNSNDLRFLSYLYMNLSQKEIATILSISPDACRKRKERIAKKIGLSEGAELYDYLYSL
tara:strand:- start:5950 stop:7587 length:1638 start_codon:yes stop_codon:yes gene_type:complete